MFLTRYLTRPNARVQRELARIKTEMNWATGVPRVGVHIRHGDTVHMQFPVWAYADAAKRIARAHGASELYFTSDDEKVYKEFPLFLGHQFQRVLHIPQDKFERTWKGYSDNPVSQQFPVTIDYSQAIDSSQDEGLQLVLNAFLLADSSWLVGASSSNVVLRAYEMAGSVRNDTVHFHDLRNQGWLSNFWVHDLAVYGPTSVVCYPRGQSTETPWERRYHAQNRGKALFPTELLPADPSQAEFDEQLKSLHINLPKKHKF